MIHVPSRGPSGPRSRADLAREEQAFYEKHANAQPWKTVFKQLAPVSLVFILLAAFAGLSLALH